MTIAGAVERLLTFGSEPPGTVIDEVLEAGRTLEGLRELLDALMRSPRVWSARLLGLPAQWIVRDDPAGMEAVGSRVFDLVAVVRPLDDWPATTGWLGVMETLAEDGNLRPRTDADRAAMVDLLWWCLSHDHPNARSAAVSFLEMLEDFGNPQPVPGHQGVLDLRRAAQSLLSMPGPPGRGDDLAGAVRLLDSIERTAE